MEAQMLMSSTQASILVCPVKHNQKLTRTTDVSVAPNFSSCFSHAARGNFDLIVINVPVGKIAIRNHILELCRGLKSHPETQDTPVVVSIEFFHRRMAIKMANAGIRFMEVREKGAPIDPDHLMYLVRQGDPSLRIDLILARLCPFLNHRTIDDERELTTCRAYRNRMVLGGKRLHEVCETDRHVYCDYFLSPRFAA